MHTLHTRAATIFSSWAEEEQSESETIDAGTGTLWIKCWCPILQGIARLCCDTRRPVRSQALTYLQRALLVHDLQTLSAVEWESCFNKVLFPLLSKLLDNINTQDPSGIEETRMRASTLLCKVFLQHLSPLLSLSTFTALWLTILEFMDKYMHADRSDLLCEAIPESLKNMLLVMYTAGILDGDDSQLWKLTWDRIDTFLPNLREDVFKPHESDSRRAAGREGASSPPPSGQTANSQPNQQVINQRSPEQAPEQQQPNSQDQTPERPRPESPLTTEMVAPPTSSYILHPPLPSVASRSSPSGSPSTLTTTSSSGVGGQKLGSVPILLNPDIMQSTTIPIISPQGTPERKTGVTADGQ